MLSRLTVLRLLSLAAVAVPLVARPTAVLAANDGEDDAGDDEGGGGDDGGGDDEGGGDEEEDGPALDPDQPAFTAGGLYTRYTYPASEIERPLTITGGMVEGRAALSFDLTSDRTFETWLTEVNGRYGVADTLEVRLDSRFTLTAPDNADGTTGDKPALIGIGVETALQYDLIDFRATAEMPVSPELKFDAVFGLPVKYRLKKNIAIVALDRFFTIHTDDRKPDLEIGVGGVFQALPFLAIVARGRVILAAFDTGNGLSVPASVAIQASPSGLFDAGLEFTFVNLKPTAEDKERGFEDWYDRRALSLFFRARM